VCAIVCVCVRVCVPVFVRVCAYVCACVCDKHHSVRMRGPFIHSASFAKRQVGKCVGARMFV